MEWDPPRTDAPSQRRIPRIWRASDSHGPMKPGEVIYDDRHRRWRVVSEHEVVRVRGKA